MIRVGLTGFFLVVMHVCYSQVYFRLGAEYGYSLPGKVENDLYKKGNEIFESRKVYHSSAVVGITADLDFLRHLCIVSGIYYQQKQTDMHLFTISGYTGQINFDKAFENYSLRYHKLCVPLGAGFIRNGRVLGFMLSGGMRINYLLEGNLRLQEEIVYANSSFYRYNEAEFNVLPVSRENKTKEIQSFVSLSFVFFQRIRLAFNYCRGASIAPKYFPSGYTRFSCNNNDYILSIAYLFKRGPNIEKTFYREGYKSVRFL